ncbi:hypothetical protein TRIUR3_25225 [Triticum urartu]|uniref:Uncharacterized protein n=1 Tax=Triticum urartu TaxID=4572 RepID=M7YNR9_TRIUA|nr:hypothetical protein TRIUR3_25225 [Triticum urartu]
MAARESLAVHEVHHSEKERKPGTAAHGVRSRGNIGGRRRARRDDDELGMVGSKGSMAVAVAVVLPWLSSCAGRRCSWTSRGAPLPTPMRRAGRLQGQRTMSSRSCRPKARGLVREESGEASIRAGRRARGSCGLSRGRRRARSRAEVQHGLERWASSSKQRKQGRRTWRDAGRWRSSAALGNGDGWRRPDQDGSGTKGPVPGDGELGGETTPG